MAKKNFLTGVTNCFASQVASIFGDQRMIKNLFCKKYFLFRITLTYSNYRVDTHEKKVVSFFVLRFTRPNNVIVGRGRGHL